MRTPTWTAPANLTGTAQGCTLTVTVGDGFAASATQGFTETVNPAPNTMTITAAPTGTPNPVVSAGSVAVSVTASDELGRALTYAWSASCPAALGGNGSFAPAASVRTPTWTAPANLTGTAQGCTLTVTVGDGFAASATQGFTATVNPAPNTVTITAAPTGTPNPVVSAGSVALSVTASDELGRALTYAWSASCPAALGGSGTFAPAASVRTPTWTAPANLTGTAQGCTLTVTVGDGFAASATQGFTETVNPAPNSITITAAPAGAPNPVASAASTSLSVTAVDELGRALTYAWSASCPTALGGSGTFAPAASVRTPTWTAPANLTGTAQGCTLTVTVGDGFAASATQGFAETVNPAPNPITITAGPGGTPNPVASAGNVALGVTASDVLGRELSYAWKATCLPGLGSHGTFSPGPNAQAPAWTAPANVSGAPQTCVITVTVTDGFGATTTQGFTETVNPAPNTITITASPTANPNPVGSAATTGLSVAASDEFGRPLTYAWSATCPGDLGGNGTFSPAASVQNPTWTAPANLAGVARSCTLTVVVSDGLGATASANGVVTVSPAPNTVTVQSTTGTPNPVASGAVMALSVVASDALGRPLNFAWSAVCPTLGGTGTFVPSAAAQNPTWTAPSNATGAPQACTLTVAVSDGFGATASGAVTATVDPAPNTVTITSTTGTPNPVGSGATMALGVTASDQLGRPLTFAWSAVCPALSGAGAFSPGAGVQNPTWAAPVNTTGNAQPCTLTVLVSDGAAASATGTLIATVNSVPHTITFSAPPAGVPNPVAALGTVALTAAATNSLNLPMTYAWQAACPALTSNGTFAPSASVQAPTWTAPGNPTGAPQGCTIQVTATDAVGSETASFTQTVNAGTHTLTITVPPSGTPNPSAPGQGVALNVTVVDSFGLTPTYLWQVTCGGVAAAGTFTPNASAAGPTWTPPAGPTGVEMTCLVRVTAATSGQAVTASYAHRVLADSGPSEVTITTPPSGTPNPGASGGGVGVTATASDSQGGPVTYGWTASCPAALSGSGTFTPSAAGQAPTWTAPANLTGTLQTCTLTVTATNGQGRSATASYGQGVNAAANTVTITAGPTGTPNPVGSSGTSALTVTATDVLGRPLTYAWSAACPAALGGAGTFAPSATERTPTWTAPANTTASVQTCTLTVVVNDGAGATATRTYGQGVTAAAALPTVTITSGPTGTPNPVGSGGPAALVVAATHSTGAALTYTWSAVCPAALGGSGSFAPSATGQTPTWTAPANGTGSVQGCTLTVVASDGQGTSATASYTQNVGAAAHTLTITVPPSGTPNPSAPGQGVALNVTVVDSFGLTPTYLWQVTCGGVAAAGTFTPNASAAGPTWTPPAGPTGVEMTCLVRVTAATSGQAVTASYAHRVLADSGPSEVTITTPPSGTPNPGASGGAWG